MTSTPTPTAPTLTDHYVRAAAWGTSGAERDELERELRTSIADAVDDRVRSGASHDDAERATLTDLGDPLVLSTRYRDRPLHVVGPRTYPAWVRTMRVLFLRVLPVIALVVLVLALLEGGSVGAALGAAVSASIDLSLWMLVVPTLLFVVVERGGDDGSWLRPWTVDDLPDDSRRARTAAAATMVTSAVVAAAAIVYQQVVGFVTRDGQAVPLLDPVLWTWPIPAFLAGLGAAAALVVIRHRVGSSTSALLLGALGVRVWLYGIAVVVALQGLLVSPDVVVALGVAGAATDWATVNLVAAVVLVALAAWSVGSVLLRHRPDRRHAAV